MTKDDNCKELEGMSCNVYHEIVKSIKNPRNMKLAHSAIADDDSAKLEVSSLAQTGLQLLVDA